MTIKGDIPQEEIDLYVTRARKEYKGEIVSISLADDGEHVDIIYKRPDMPFQRIARITGYLTSTIDRWNDAKKAELKDRVKHDVL